MEERKSYGFTKTPRIEDIEVILMIQEYFDSNSKFLVRMIFSDGIITS